MKVNRIVLFSLAVLAFGLTAHAAEPPAIELRLIEKGFKDPLYFINDPAGRNFVVERNGRVWLLVDGRKTKTPYLDVRDRVFEDNECGFLSIAFHPQFAKNGRLFVNYTGKRPKLQTVISEFKADPKAVTVDPSTEKVVLTIDQPYNNHNGGLNLFGPDGMLYIGMGDGGNGGDPQNRAQNPQELLGKMLRIDVSEVGKYTVPKDNPFVDDSKYRPEIWATGLRNPWRFSFDRKTGLMYAGDVGQGTWEEIDVVTAGGNYGWRVREGLHLFNKRDKATGPYIDPIAEYKHDMDTGGLSVTGGYVYRGKLVPEWQGIYFYADYASGRFWGVRYEDGKVTWSGQIPVTVGPRTGPNLVSVSSFGEDIDGELYVCDLQRGFLYQMTPKK